MIVSAEDLVEIRRVGEETWAPLRVGDQICPEDLVRLGPNARADVKLPDEADVRLRPGALVSFLPPEDGSRTLLNLIRGVIFVISRDSRALSIRTPFVNAGLEGTEFLIEVDGEDFILTVYEGEVALGNESGQVAVGGGRSLSATRGDLSGPVTEVDDRADLLWALYYPVILDGPLLAADAEISAMATDPAMYTARAQTRLRVGHIDTARTDLDRALALVPDYAPALALEAMILLAEGDTGTAIQAVERGLRQNDQSVAALLANSYIRMERDSLREALQATTRAVELAPDSALAHARHAHALLALEAVSAALTAANQALALDPNVADGHSAMGFAWIASGDFTASIGAFEAAISHDSASALPRIGLAIALNRTGRSVAARDEIATAVALAPNDSLVRSYMGKTYADEFRTELAGEQLEIAKTLPSNDQTARLYDSQHEQMQNRPIAAFENLTEASALSGDSLRFRSTLHQDEDLMTRGAGIGPIYRLLGAEDLALEAGTRSLVANPGDYSAHRLVSDMSARQSRREIWRVNEAFQARMLQPISVQPFAPQLALTNVYIAESAGPIALEHLQATSGFARNGLDFQVSAITGGLGIRGEDLVVAGLYDRMSFNLGQYHYEFDGFRLNNDFEHDAYSGHFQYRLSPETSFQTELRSTRVNRGDTMLLFDPDRLNTQARHREESDSIQVGINQRLSTRGRLIGSVTLQQGQVSATSGDAFTIDVDADISIVELQHIGTFSRWNIVSGIRAVSSDLINTAQIQLALPFPPFTLEETVVTDGTSRHSLAYVYANRSLTDKLVLTIGGAVDSLDLALVSESRSSPKLGLSWSPQPGTSLRVATFETLQGQIISRQLQLPSLEPMQVAGSGQYWTGTEGEIARNYEISGEFTAAQRIRYGFRHTERSISTPFSITGLSSSEVETYFLNSRESLSEAHLFWIPTDKLALRFGWESDDFDFHGTDSPYSFSRLQTKRVPMQASVFISDRFSVRGAGIYISQHGLFSAPFPDPGFFPDSSRFWTFDASLDIRLPNRRGSIEVAAKNLFDDNSKFQDRDPENPHIFPERIFLARFTLLY